MLSTLTVWHLGHVAMLLKCFCGCYVLQVQTQLANHVAAVLPAILVGLACGVLGTIFTVLNVKVVRWRDAIIQVHSACVVRFWLTGTVFILYALAKQPD